MSELDRDKVICPNCTHQFGATPLSVQLEIIHLNERLENNAENYQLELHELRKQMVSEANVHRAEIERLKAELADAEKRGMERALDIIMNKKVPTRVVGAVADVGLFLRAEIAKMGVK